MKLSLPLKLAPTALLLLAAGCAEDWRPRSFADSGPHAVGHPALSEDDRTGGLASHRRARAESFARLPDRGDLVGYPEQRVVRRDGAYTWHRADLSEEHALAAVGDGSLRLTTPSGEALDFRYERHVEHPSGDWTWIGRLEGGHRSDEVVLTFGEKAAFGTIAQPGKAPLKLTIQGGVAWLIETDRAKIASIRNDATRPSAPDYLVPPDFSPMPSPAAGGPATASAPAMASSTSSTSPVIDLVLGYTSGFASALGGQSQAVTRLNNLVEITNQAYANSQIGGRVRLVHTLQVEYADNTSNSDTLEKLTGYKSGTGWITPDPAFSALRAARDTYGADLVSLVRKFNTPENDGCGIAWLLGGGQTVIDSTDAPFGYSIVSDGRDAGTDGKTYFCREETLAHEIGHNLGAQHDTTTATKDGKLSYGAYSYSFGHKTGSTTGNFYTVMAYGDSGQVTYRAFSNPQITFCGGLACGTSQADNARSHHQTMPVIAAFRPAIAVSPPKATELMVCDGLNSDFSGDGKSDILWRHTTEGRNVLWSAGSSSTPHELVEVPPAQSVEVAGIGDFNGDGVSDILWRHASDGWTIIWRSGDFAQRQEISPSLSQIWRVVGIGDFDGDGRSDVLWRHMSEGLNVLWKSGNAQTAEELTTVTSQTWRVAGVGDFDGDGRADILWRHMIDGRNMVWRSGDSATPQELTTVPLSQNVQVAGVADFNRDGRSDVLWRHAIEGWNVVWMSGRSSDSRWLAAVPVSQSVQIAGIGDFDGDGSSDILWRHTSDGWSIVWGSGNFADRGGINSGPSPLWKVAGMCRADGF